MKEYPKVPRYDHPSVEPATYEAGDLWLTEKLDGSGFRFLLYEDRFAEAYSAAVRDLDPADGDLVFGTRRVVRGTSGRNLEAIAGSLHRAVRRLREVDSEAIRALYEEWESPITFFAENMILHTIDYDYGERPPPALLGFDAYAPALDPAPDETPGNPFEERFEGFLPAEAVFGPRESNGENEGLDGIEGNENDASTAGEPGVFERIGLETVLVLEAELDAGNVSFEPADYEIPQSTFADRQAEGVVIRNDAADRRTKIVTEEFRELNRQRWGGHRADAESGAEEFVAIFCTNARIRKQVRKMVVEKDYEFSRSIIEELYPRVVADIWAEEYEAISRLEFSFTPSEVRPLVARRCAEVVTMIETNARLNDAPPETLWAGK
jgi:hypothetical protein